MPTSGLREKSKHTGRIIAIIVAVIWAGAIFSVSSIPGSGFPPHPSIVNIIAHFCEYLIFAVILSLALNSPNRALWKTALFALIIASLYAISDEFHQYFIPGRLSDPMDWLTDTLGATLGAAATIWFISSRRVSSSRTRDAKRKKS